jgi:hypothetical protein
MKKNMKFIENNQTGSTGEIYLLLGFTSYNIEMHTIRCGRTISIDWS